MIARREILAIGQEELRFRRDEIQHLATQLRGETPSPGEVEDWEVRLEGWPAGTVLALQPLPEELARVMLSGGNGPEALFNDLARSMLQSQPPDMHDFLLSTSTLPRVTPELCTQALELPDSINLLSSAINRNMFLTRVTGGLAYHALFRDFLQQRLLETDADRYYDLHLRAARWLSHQMPHSVATMTSATGSVGISPAESPVTTSTPSTPGSSGPMYQPRTDSSSSAW